LLPRLHGLGVVTEKSQVDEHKQISTLVSLLCLPMIPVLFAFFSKTHDWGYAKTGLVSFLTVVVVRAIIDRVMRIAVPPPSLYGVTDPQARADDIARQRRYWFWRFWSRVGIFYTIIVALTSKHHGGFAHHFTHLAPSLLSVFSHPAMLLQGVQVIALFAVNFLIFMGPMLAMGISQMKLIEPGDAKFGVSLDSVRGQKEAKEEIRRVVEIWQSGEQFEKLGGKRESGMLLMGPPGVGNVVAGLLESSTPLPPKGCGDELW
jgi:cell division protease FtsH